MAREATCQQGEPCGDTDSCPDPIGCGFVAGMCNCAACTRRREEDKALFELEIATLKANDPVSVRENHEMEGAVAKERARCLAWIRAYWDGDEADDYVVLCGIRDGIERAHD